MNGELNIIYDGCLYKYRDVKPDLIGQRYKMKLIRYRVMYYSRRTERQYSIVKNEISIFISNETPIIKTSAPNLIINNLHKNWKDVFDYAINKSEPSWITYTIGIEIEEPFADIDTTRNRLDLTQDEFKVLALFSPYS